MNRSFAPLVAVAVIALTFFVLMLQPPERVSVVSEDGRVIVSGVVHSDVSLRVLRRDDLVGPYSFVQPPVYEVGPLDLYVQEPLVITFRVPLEMDMSTALGSSFSLGYLDRELGAWVPVLSDYDPSSGTLSADLRRGGYWALLYTPRVFSTDTAEQMVRELLAAPPEGAVGYTIVLSVASQPGDFVVADAAYRVGGCAGAFRQGQAEQMTLLEREGEDSVPETIRAQAVWEVSDGCPQGETIE